MKNENQDIVGEKCIKDDDGNLAFDDKSKLLGNVTTKSFLMLSSPGTVRPCLKNSHLKEHLLGLPLRSFVKHCQR